MAYQSLRQRYPQYKVIPILILLSALLLGFGLSRPLMNVGKMYVWRNDYSCPCLFGRVWKALSNAIHFESEEGQTKVSETFDAESTHPIEMQRGG